MVSAVGSSSQLPEAERSEDLDKFQNTKLRIGSNSGRLNIGVDAKFNVLFIDQN